MKKQGILNYQIETCIARIGHTQSIVICDAGLPVPQGKTVVDIALIPGVPTFLQVLDAIAGEMVIESYVYAEEIMDRNPEVFQAMSVSLDGLPSRSLSHEAFKMESLAAEVFIRTGECSPYSNVILIGGVTF